MSVSSINLTPKRQSPVYTVCLAGTEEEVRQCLWLLDSTVSNCHGSITGACEKNPVTLENPAPHCRYLMVKEFHSGETVAAAHLLFEPLEGGPIGFDCESKFYLAPLLALPGRLMEITKLCCHKNHHNSKVITTLWQGLASVMVIHKIDYIFSTVSISIADGGQYARRIADFIQIQHAAAPSLLVQPKSALSCPKYHDEVQVLLPRELKNYLRYGAVVCGEPYWNKRDGLAEILLFLDRNTISKYYLKSLAEHI
jgi:hypothetical protein